MNRTFRSRLEQIYMNNYKRYYRLTVKLLKKYTNNPDHAADIVHDAFLLAGEKADENNPYLEAWIAKTIKNLCLNYSRTFYKQMEITNGYVEKTSRNMTAPSFENCADIKLALEQKLSPEDSKLLIDYCIKRTPVEQIAEKTNLTPNAIRVRIFRIRRILEQVLVKIFSFFLVIITAFQYIL